MRTVVLAGAWLAALIALLGGQTWLQAAVGAGAVGASVLAFPDRRGFLLACAALGVVALAWLRWQVATAPPPPASIAWWADGERHTLAGRIAARPEVRGATQRFAVHLTEIETPSGPIPVTGAVQVRVSASRVYQAGDRLRLDGVLEPPPRLGDFDYPAYLARRGIHAVMEYPRIGVTGHQRPGGVAGVLAAVQRRGHDALWRGLPAAQAALAEGILLGRRAEIPRDINEDFNRAGVSHLIVISGFNIALVGGVVMGATTWLVGRRRAGLVALVAIAGYSAVVGLTPPVARAAVMGGVAVLAMLSGRPHGSGVTLLLAAAVLTAQDPRILADLSFQLSFAATAGLVVLSPPLLALGRRIWAEPAATFQVSWRSFAVALWDVLAVTLAATVATLPLLLLSFDRLSTVSPLANLLLVPLFPLVLIGGAVGLAVATVVPAVAAVALAPLGILLDLSLAVTRLCAALPWATVSVPGVSERQVIAFYVVLATVTVLRIPRPGAVLPDVAVHPPAPLATLSLPALALAPPLLLAAAVAASLVHGRPPGDAARLDVLGLAGAPATLVTLPGGGRVLVDTGLAPGEARGALDRILPRNGSPLAAVVITRDTPSTVGGLGEVLARFRVPLLLVPPEADTAAWVDAARAAGVSVVLLRPFLTIGNDTARLQALRAAEAGRWSVTLVHGDRTLDFADSGGDAGFVREGRATLAYVVQDRGRLETTVRTGESASIVSAAASIRLRPPRGRTITVRPCTVDPCGPPSP